MNEKIENRNEKFRGACGTFSVLCVKCYVLRIYIKKRCEVTQTDIFHLPSSIFHLYDEGAGA
jgi:hypothetical protein